MNERQPISKKLRFEVFKRDSFTCQYCGMKAPDVVLHCDHINPVAAGGGSDILNLVTSCFDCNSGKGARKLSDNDTLNKQRDQLGELQERRDQIEMLIEWREGLANLDSDVVSRLEETWIKITEGATTLTPTGRDNLKKYVSKYGVDLTIRAMQESCISYLKRDADHKYTKESCDSAFGSIGRVAAVLKRSAGKPYLKRLYYIRGILRNRLTYMVDWQAMQLMERAAEYGIDLDELESFAKRVRNWTSFKQGLDDYMDSVMGGTGGDGQD